MKKFVALLLALCLSLSVCCVFAEEAGNPDLENAKLLLREMYKSNKEATTPKDYDVVGGLNIGGVIYPIEWTADNETVKFVAKEDGMVTVDVDEKNPDEIFYTMTATIKDEAGNAVTLEFKPRKVPAALLLDTMTDAEIAAKAYELDESAAMPVATALKGAVTEINTAYSEEYGNITVTIAVEGAEDKTIQCYRLKGEGAEALAVGDVIGVAGTIKNYKGTIELDSGCTIVPADSVKDIRTVYVAYTLEDGMAKDEAATLTGVISEINTPFDEKYGNVTVTIVVGGLADNSIQCYRLAGEGADTVAVGDTITVTGTLKNYKGTIEFDSGCTLDAVVKAE